jgi:hypothetical protein
MLADMTHTTRIGDHMPELGPVTPLPQQMNWLLDFLGGGGGGPCDSTRGYDDVSLIFLFNF